MSLSLSLSLLALAIAIAHAAHWAVSLPACLPACLPAYNSLKPTGWQSKRLQPAGQPASQPDIPRTRYIQFQKCRYLTSSSYNIVLSTVAYLISTQTNTRSSRYWSISVHSLSMLSRRNEWGICLITGKKLILIVYNCRSLDLYCLLEVFHLQMFVLHVRRCVKNRNWSKYSGL